MKLSRSLSIFLLISLATISEASIPTSDNKAALIMFEGMCLKNDDNFDNIPYYLKLLRKSDTVKIKALDETFVNADPVLRRLGGVAYSYQDAQLAVVIAWSNKGGCSFVGSTTNIDALKRLLVQSYNLREIDRNREGFQFGDTYAFPETSLLSGGIILVSYSGDATENFVFTISFLPKRNVPKLKS